MFKKLYIDLSLSEAIVQAPSYIKFLKEFLARKRKLEDYETINLNEACSTILQRKLLPKLKDSRSFNIPCKISDHLFKSLYDLGTSVNLMHYKVFEKLNLGEVTPSTVCLQMSDHSCKWPRRILEDVLVTTF